MSWEIIGIWVATLLTFGIASFLYKDNPVYKIAEHIYLGVALGYGLTIYFWDSIKPNAIDKVLPSDGSAPEYLVWIPIVLGLFILLRVIPSLAWLSRWSFAVYIGGNMGILVPSVIANLLMPQLASAMRPLYDTAQPLNAQWGPLIGQAVILIATFATMIYFFFSLEHRGFVGKLSRLGVLFIMISFGAGFGYTVMARMSLLIGRFQFLIIDFFGRALGLRIG
ncbi:hypothetical protein IT575_03210 [bacterium]|nr:hypothetical protein [bacterium]